LKRYCNTLDEAILILEYIKLLQASKESSDKAIKRNQEGIAFIQVGDLQVLLSDDKYLEMAELSWCNADGYIVNSKNKISIWSS